MSRNREKMFVVSVVSSSLVKINWLYMKDGVESSFLFVVNDGEISLERNVMTNKSLNRLLNIASVVQITRKILSQFRDKFSPFWDESHDFGT